jgi:hypothetical protein
MLILFAYIANQDIMAVSESIPIERLADRLQNATEGMVFAGVVALTRTAKHAQRAIQDNLPDVMHIRNKWTIQGIRITPATKQNQEAEVYSKDWYMPIHEEGGSRTPKPVMWVPSKNLRLALGLGIRDMIPKGYTARNILKGKKAVHGNRPFYAVMKSHDIRGIFVRTSNSRLPIQLLYQERTDPITIPQRKWFMHVVDEAYDKYLEQEYNTALMEAWAK